MSRTSIFFGTVVPCVIGGHIMNKVYVWEILQGKEEKKYLHDQGVNIMTPEEYQHNQDDIKEIELWKNNCPLWKKWCTHPDIKSYK